MPFRGGRVACRSSSDGRGPRDGVDQRADVEINRHRVTRDQINPRVEGIEGAPTLHPIRGVRPIRQCGAAAEVGDKPADEAVTTSDLIDDHIAGAANGSDVIRRDRRDAHTGSEKAHVLRIDAVFGVHRQLGERTKVHSSRFRPPKIQLLAHGVALGRSHEELKPGGHSTPSGARRRARTSAK